MLNAGFSVEDFILLNSATILSGQVTSGEDLTRICPNPKNNPRCKGIIIYKRADSKERAEKYKSVCCCCRQYGYKRTDKTKQLIRKARTGRKDSAEARASKSKAMKGESNPFYGRKHTEASKLKIGAASVGRYFGPETRKKQGIKAKGRKKSAEEIAKIRASKTLELRANLSERFSGENNPFYGKKHTEETCQLLSELASQRCASDITKHKMSVSHSGEKNYMYGKPPPAGTSNTIGGWLDGLYFRSSCELEFLLEHKDENWSSAEIDKFAVPYINRKEQKRFYYPDFVLGNLLVEVKPIGGEGIPSKRNMELKIAAALEFCESRGLSYRIVELSGLSKKEVYILRQAKVIKLNSRWECKYQKWLETGKLR